MIWNYLGFFYREEPWGEPDRICGYLLLALEVIRKITGWIIIIHFGTQGGHSKTGYHPKAMAVDFHFKTKTSFKKQVDNLLRILDKFQFADFVGLGIYPEWNTPGFHLDVRGTRARWGYLSGKYVSWEYVVNSIKAGS